MKLAFYLLASILVLCSCDLQKNVDLVFPDYEREIVVECYLEPGKPYRLLLTESTAFGASPLPNAIVPAIVTIEHKGIIDTLKPIPTIDTSYYKFYNYVSDKLVEYDTINDFNLEIKLVTTLKKISARTKFVSIIPIQSYQFIVREDSAAAIRVLVTDPPNQTNYYRLLINGDTLRAPERFKQTFADDLFTGGRVTFFSTYRFDVGDPLILTLHHLTEEHYFFLRSIQDAIAASNNPFSVPSRIRTNIKGGTGIFTTLSFDRKYTRVSLE